MKIFLMLTLEKKQSSKYLIKASYNISKLK